MKLESMLSETRQACYALCIRSNNINSFHMLQLFPYGNSGMLPEDYSVYSEVVLEGYNYNYKGQSGQIRNSLASPPGK